MATTYGVPFGNQLSAVEIALTYNGDYQLTSNGDLATVQDTPYSPAATIQRVMFLILTSPVILNVTQTAPGAPDDMFNPTYGSGARAFIGRNQGQGYITALKRNIQNGLALDPYVLNVPRPIVNVQNTDASTAVCSVQFTAITGQVITIPDIQISGANAV